MRYDALQVPAGDGTELLVHCHRPDVATDRVLLVSHGASEHGGRYAHVARYFVEQGWNVVVPDHRGHGRSGGTAMYVDTFLTYSHDLDTLHRALQLDPARTLMFGHSMGGLIAARFHQILADEPRTCGLVLSSPLLGIRVPIPWWKLALGRAVRYVNPRFRFETEVRIEDTTRNADAISRRLEDELMHQHVTAGWFFAMQDAVARVWEEAEKIRVPVLLLQAGDDLIVDPAVGEPWLASVGSQDKTFRLFEGRYHELHNEPEWMEAVGVAAEWLDERLPADQGRGASDAFEAAIAECRSRMTNVDPGLGTMEAPLSTQKAVAP
jgi:lysophospholipase